MKDIDNIKEDTEIKKTLKDKIKGYKSEFTKIVWPTRKELFKQTVSVLVTCVIFFIIIFCMDFVFNKIIEIIAKFVG